MNRGTVEMSARRPPSADNETSAAAKDEATTVLPPNLLSRVDEWLNGTLSLLKFGGLSLAAALAVAFGWTVMHRGEMQLMPFEGANDGAALSMQFARALDDVGLGAQSGLNVDVSLRQASEAGPPAVSIPGTGVSLAALIGSMQLGPLAQTRVHGALVKEGEKSQVVVQVTGPHVNVHAFHTDTAADAEQALVQAAAQLYGVLKPIVAAAYLSTRDPQASLELVHNILDDPASSGDDKATAYRIWGLVLRDRQLDLAGARERFRRALDGYGSSGAPRSRALIWVDIGHTYLWERRWDEAESAYRTAAAADDRWAVPHNFLGDTLQGRGALDESIGEYRTAIRLDSLYVDPWNGLGRLYLTRGDYEAAIDSYMRARFLIVRPDRTAAFTYYGLGDALFRVGCDDAAAQQYDRAVEIEPAFETARYDSARASACQVSASAPPDSGPPWRIASGVAKYTGADCVFARADEHTMRP